MTIRIRDRGGGISPEVLPNIWSYSFTTFSEDELPGQSPGSGSMDALNAISGAGGEGSSIAGLDMVSHLEGRTQNILVAASLCRACMVGAVTFI